MYWNSAGEFWKTHWSNKGSKNIPAQGRAMWLHSDFLEFHSVKLAWTESY